MKEGESMTVDLIDPVDRIDVGNEPRAASHDLAAIAAFVRVLAIPLGREIAGHLRPHMEPASAAAAEAELRLLLAKRAEVEEKLQQTSELIKRLMQAQLRAVTAQRDELAKDLAAARLNIEAYKERLGTTAPHDGQGERRDLIDLVDRFDGRCAAPDDDERAVEACCGNCYYRVEGLCTQEHNPQYGKAMDDDDGCVTHAFSPPGISRRMPSPLGAAGKCEKCLRWTSGVCRSDTGPKANLTVGAGDGCPMWLPRAAALLTPPVPDGDGNGDGPRKRRPSGQKTGPQPRARCPHCATEHAVIGKSPHLFPHDAGGVEYRLGRGDRSRPCPGNEAAVEKGAVTDAKV
jgi:hypothetical protein